MKFWHLFRRPDPLVRGLYAYHDGRRKRLADPLVVDAALRRHGGENWADSLGVLSALDKVTPTGNLAAVANAQRDEAVRTLVDLARQVFDLPAVDDRGRGVSSGECLGVLARYLGFLADLKERWAPLPTLPARLASSPTEPDTGEWSPLTSTSREPASDGPTILPMR